MAESNKKLVEDVKVVLSDIEDVLSDIKGKTSKEFAELQDALTVKLESTKEKLIASEEDFLNKEKIAVEMTDSYVRNHAWKLALIGAVIGFLVGYTMR